MAIWTRQDLENQTLQLLGQASNSPAFALPSGTGSGLTITGSDQLALWFDEAIRSLATTCYPVWGKATWTAWTANKRQDLLANGTGQLDSAGGADSSVLWSPEQVTWSGIKVEGPWDRNRLAGVISSTGASLLDTATAPSAWGVTGQMLWFYPIPSQSAAVVGYGLMVPPRLTSLSTPLDWISDRGAWLVSLYAAGKAALVRQDDALIAPRAGVWLAQWDQERRDMWMDLEASLRMRHYTDAPTPTLISYPPSPPSPAEQG